MTEVQTSSNLSKSKIFVHNQTRSSFYKLFCRSLIIINYFYLGMLIKKMSTSNETMGRYHCNMLQKYPLQLLQLYRTDNPALLLKLKN